MAKEDTSQTAPQDTPQGTPQASKITHANLVARATQLAEDRKLSRAWIREKLFFKPAAQFSPAELQARWAELDEFKNKLEAAKDV